MRVQVFAFFFFFGFWFLVFGFGLLVFLIFWFLVWFGVLVWGFVGLISFLFSPFLFSSFSLSLPFNIHQKGDQSFRNIQVGLGMPVSKRCRVETITNSISPCCFRLRYVLFFFSQFLFFPFFFSLPYFQFLSFFFFFFIFLFFFSLSLKLLQPQSYRRAQTPLLPVHVREAVRRIQPLSHSAIATASSRPC